MILVAFCNVSAGIERISDRTTCTMSFTSSLCNTTPSDYPVFARRVADVIREGRAERGVIICGSGVGVCVAANKIDGIRAGMCHDTYSAHQGVEHDDMNVLCIGSRIVGGALASEVVAAFLAARLNTTEERYTRRLKMVEEIERERR